MDEAKERLTSTGFIEKLHYMDMVECKHDRRDYMLASIIAELRSIKEGFSENPQPVAISDCLLFNPKKDEEDEKDLILGEEEKDLISEQGADRNVLPLPADRGRKKRKAKKGHEIGKPLDEKWAAVNQNAKTVWAARFGIPMPPMEG